MSYGRFDGDGRTAVDIGGRRITRAQAQKIIDRFNETGSVHSLTGLTAEVVLTYCDDLKLNYSVSETRDCKIVRKYT